MDYHGAQALIRSSTRVARLCRLGFLLILSSAPSIAAESSDQANTGSLQEIVITAERHEQTVQKAALTIQVLSSEDLQAAGISNTSDLEKVTTGVEIGVGGANNQIFIRGVGSFAYSPLSTPGVAFNVDGVYVPVAKNR